MSNARETIPLGTTPTLENSGSHEWTTHVETIARDRYSLAEEIAQGGIGRILSAHDKRLERQVALKQLLDPSPENEARFLREALVTAKLQHPAIVPVYDVGRFPDGEIFYAMKLVTGRSLGEVVAEAQSFDERLALLPHVIAVAEAIAYAHSEHIVHRDLKPANVLIGPFGETVVIDWGIAKDLQEQEAQREAVPARQDSNPSGDGMTSLTMDGAVLGTPGYMPPEQAGGNAVDERADVYALGAILYHVLAGVAPYEGKSGMDVLARVLTEPPPDLAQRERRVPRDLLAIVTKAMARDPRDRYPTAKEFAHDLRRFQTGQIVGAYHYSRRERLYRFVQRHRAVAATTALGLLVVGVIGFTSLARVVDARRIAEIERDRANDERGRAEEKQSEAESASRKASQQTDELLLIEARAAARRDPNAAIRWLSTLSASFNRWGEARLVAADAQEYGIAKTLLGHSGAINMIVYSSDGSLIATASDDRKIGIWTSEGKLLHMLEGHTDEVWRVIFKGNQRLVSSSKDGTIRLWDVEKGEVVRVLQAQDTEVRGTTLVDDESRIALLNCAKKRVEVHDAINNTFEALPGEVDCPSHITVSKDQRHIVYVVNGKPRMMDLTTHEFRDFSGKEGYCILAYASKDEKYIGCAGLRGYTSLWDVKTGRQIDALAPVDIPNFGTVQFSPDGRQFLFGRDSALFVRNLESGKTRSFEQHDGPLFAAAFSQDGQKIVTTSFDRSAIVLDLATEARHQHFGFRDATSWADFSPNNDAVAVGSWDATARIFPLAASRNRVVTKGLSAMKAAQFSADGQSIISLEKNGTIHIDPVGDTKKTGASEELEGEKHALSCNGQFVAYATPKSVLRMHEIGKQTPDVEFEKQSEAIDRIMFSTKSNWLLTVGANHTVRLWNLKSRQSRILTAVESSVHGIAFSNDDTLVALSDSEGNVRVFPTSGGPERTLKGHFGIVPSLLFLPDDKRLVSGGFDHRIRIWDLETNQARVIDASGLGIVRLLASRDGKTLYSLGMEASIRRWDVETGNLLAILRGHRTVVSNIDLAPEGTRLVSTGSNGDIRVWDLATGQSRMLEGHQNGVAWIMFSPEGDRFISAGQDGTTRIWYDDLPFEGSALRKWMTAISPEAPNTKPIVN